MILKLFLINAVFVFFLATPYFLDTFIVKIRKLGKTSISGYRYLGFDVKH